MFKNGRIRLIRNMKTFNEKSDTRNKFGSPQSAKRVSGRMILLLFVRCSRRHSTSRFTLVDAIRPDLSGVSV